MRTNRFLAVLLAATMVFGSTVTAFATDPTESATGTGDAVIGAGQTEGYVNTNVVKVVLPTVSTSTFAFIMDPQKMLESTNGARLGTTWTSPGASDTYVYFNTSKGYQNKSDTVYFINKSSDKDLFVTVNAKLTEDSTKPVGLAAKNDLATADTTKLYLGLSAGNEVAQITNASAGVNVIVKAAKPTAAQYTVQYDTKNKKYVLAEVAGATFQAVPIFVEGAVKTIASDVVAPSLALTWSWTDTTATPTGSAASVNYVTTNAYTVTNATLDQTATAYGSFYGGIGAAKGGKLAINGTASSVITFADEIDKVEFSATPSTESSFAANTALVTAKGKAVTIKGTVWNATGTSALTSGSKIKVTFKDPDNDASTTNTPDPIYFEK